jgi:hypothetical protein
MHILFLSDNFPPEVNAPASRTFEHCRLWVQEGHRVTVVTSAPNFPTGRVFDGYKNRLWRRETMAGIEVVRVWTYVTANQGFLRRTLDYLSFMISGSAASLFVRGVDVVVGTSPQFFTACAAFFVGLAKRRPFIFELRDLWPESIKAVGAMRNAIALRALERVELFLYRRAARIVSVTNSFRANLAARGIDSGKIDVVTNGVDLSRFSPRPKDLALTAALGLEGKFVAGYVGTHGMAHGLETLLMAAKRLSQLPGGDAFRIVLLGDGARKQSLRAEAARLELNNTIFIDSVPKDEVSRYWSLLDVSIIHLRRSALFETVIPSKLFECMGMGIPVVHGVAGESAEIVRREGVGIVFEPENADALVEALRAFSTDKASLEACRARCVAAARHYDRSAMGRAMLASLGRALAERLVP